MLPAMGHNHMILLTHISHLFWLIVILVVKVVTLSYPGDSKEEKLKAEASSIPQPHAAAPCAADADGLIERTNSEEHESITACRHMREEKKERGAVMVIPSGSREEDQGQCAQYKDKEEERKYGFHTKSFIPSSHQPVPTTLLPTGSEVITLQ